MIILLINKKYEIHSMPLSGPFGLMKRETSKEKEALLLVNDLPARERSPLSASTNPHAPIPSRQFHYIPSISFRR